jgi:arginine exporter protein ArgO
VTHLSVHQRRFLLIVCALTSFITLVISGVLGIAALADIFKSFSPGVLKITGAVFFLISILLYMSYKKLARPFKRYGSDEAVEFWTSLEDKIKRKNDY